MFAALAGAIAVSAICCLPTAPAPEVATAGPRNLIVITIDTLRADHMSLYGYPRRTTPGIERFARRGVTFDRAIAPWPKTVPSMVSMFTGRYPHATGIMFGSRNQFVPDREVMLAEIASDHGLATGAVVSNGVLGSNSNFWQGFETYIETYATASPFGDDARHMADTVTFHAIRWLESRDRTRPFFLWVHYVDPHAPYEPPTEYVEPYLQDRYYDPTVVRVHEQDRNLHGISSYDFKRHGGRSDIGYYHAAYDGEIAFVDHQVSALLERLESEGLFEDSVITLTADHGESLGDHDYYFDHGRFPYNACGWIPWIVYWPEMPDPGARASDPVSLVDLVPTVAELFGWDLQDNLVQGNSVVPVLRGDVPYVRRHVLLEAGGAGLAQDEFIRALQDERWKLIDVPTERFRRQMRGNEYELYDVIADPGETNDLARRRPRIVARLLAALDERLEELGPPAPAPERPPDYSPEEVESLRALGYIR